MSQFLGFGPSGLVCVDSQFYQPWLVQARMNQLTRAFKDPKMGFRLYFVNWAEFSGVPSLGFMYDRWPRYLFKRNSTKKQADQTSNQSKNESESGSGSTRPQRINGTPLGPPEGAAKATKGHDTSQTKAAPFAISVQYFDSVNHVI